MSFDCWAAGSAAFITLANLPAPSRFLQTRAEDVTGWRDGWRQCYPAPDLSQRRLQHPPLLVSLSNHGHCASVSRLAKTSLQGQDNQMAERSVPPRLIQLASSRRIRSTSGCPVARRTRRSARPT